MNIWLVTIGEPWPTDGGSPRLHRSGINAGFLASRGHQVTYWTGTFDNISKKERAGHDVEFRTAQNYRLVGIEASGYARNVSFKRIRYHRAVTRRFLAMAECQPAPDMIVVSLTPLELARAVVEFGRRRKISVIVDVRDMWPDIWAERLPGILRPFRHQILKPFYDDLRAAVRGATAVIGITDAAVDWAMDSVGRKRSPRDRGFPLVYPADKPAEKDVEAAVRYWRQGGATEIFEGITGCFFGTFTKRVDFQTPLKAISQMPDELRSKIRLVLCGQGENQSLIQEYARNVPQIICHGWVDAPQIAGLMRLSQFGLLPYPPTLDFVRSLPNKVFEYLSGGVPILTSLRGEIESLFSAYSCGALYSVAAPASFQSLIAQLLHQPEQLEQMTLGARRAAMAYDTIAMCEAFLEYLGGVQVENAGTV